VFGIDRNLLIPVIRVPRVGGGDPAPNEIGPGQALQLELVLQAAPAGTQFGDATHSSAQQSVNAFGVYGDEHRVDIAVTLDGKPASGLSVVFGGPQKTFLPLAQR
jgi:hypothetical protein